LSFPDGVNDHIRIVKCLDHASCGRKEKYIQVVVGKPAGERSLGRLGCKWENIIETDLEKHVWCELDSFSSG
jgi:hypothetical protein